MGTFRFEIGQSVHLLHSEERGTVIGRAEYREYPPSYLVRYKAADGRQVEQWWQDSAII
jgi:hypothetical protein